MSVPFQVINKIKQNKRNDGLSTKFTLKFFADYVIGNKNSKKQKQV